MKPSVTIDGFSLKIKLTVNDFKGSQYLPPKMKFEGIVNKCIHNTNKAI